MSSDVQTEPSTRDFDFWMGRWKVHNRRLRERLAGSDEWGEFEAMSVARPILDGMGNEADARAPSSSRPSPRSRRCRRGERLHPSASVEARGRLLGRLSLSRGNVPGGRLPVATLSHLTPTMIESGRCSGGEVAAAGLSADEARELPLQSGDLAPPLPEFASVGVGLLEAAELGDARADPLEEAVGWMPLGERGHQAASSNAGVGSTVGSIASRGRRRPSPLGNLQVRPPDSSSTAGRRMLRMTNASRKTATAIETPNSCRARWSPRAGESGSCRGRSTARERRCGIRAGFRRGLLPGKTKHLHTRRSWISGQPTSGQVGRSSFCGD